MSPVSTFADVYYIAIKASQDVAAYPWPHINEIPFTIVHRKAFIHKCFNEFRGDGTTA